MNFFETIARFFQNGGHFMYPIAVVAVIGVAIGVERWIYLTVTRSRNRALWQQVEPLLGQGNFRQAAQVASQSDSAVGQILNYGLARVTQARRRDDIEKAMEESLIEVIPRLEKRTHYLATLANIGMLMGLLGTVIGLIRAFAAVASVNPAEKASMLSASISVAMNNTALGLALAITLLLCHMYLETKTTELVDSLEVATVKFLNTVDENRLAGETGTFRAPADAARGATRA